MRPRLGECACVYVRFADFRLSMNHVLLGRGEWWRWTEMAGAGWEGGAWSAMDMRLNGWPWGRERQSINAGVELRNIVDGSTLPVG